MIQIGLKFMSRLEYRPFLYNITFIGTLIVSFLSILVPFAYASAVPPAMDWIQNYSLTMPIYFDDVTVVGDGYVFLGSYFVDNKTGIMLIKTDKYGNSVWNHSYDIARVNLGEQITNVGDGLVISGGGLGQYYIMKSDFQGNLLWNATYRMVNDEGKMLAVADDGFIVLGKSFLPNETLVTNQIFKIDRNGNLSGTKALGNMSSPMIMSVETGYDRCIILGLASTFIEGSGIKRYIVLAITDLDGNLLWDRQYPADQVIPSGAIAVDDGYIIGGTVRTENNYTDVFIMKIDLASNPLWERTFGGTHYDSANDIIRVDDGIVIVGITNSYGNENDINVSRALLLKTDFNGNLLWNTSYGDPQYKAINGYRVVEDDNHNYVIAGWAFLNEQYIGQNGINTRYILIKTTEKGLEATPMPAPDGMITVTIIISTVAILIVSVRWQYR